MHNVSETLSTPHSCPFQKMTSIFGVCYFPLSPCGLVIVKDSAQEVPSEH